MNREVRDALRARRRYVILEYAKDIGNVKRACSDFDVPRSSFYRWKEAYCAEGKTGLLRKKPIANNHPRRIPDEFIEIIRKDDAARAG